ncbi:MAG: VWA domain-containing protein, partial [Anaerotignaceae bacterium]
EIALQGFKGYINPQGTNIEGALKTASSLIESNSEKRIVLITDGNETMGNALNQVPTLIAQNIVIDGVYLENTIEEEVQLTSIKTPSYMNKNTLYDIEVTADSLTNTQGTLKIYKGNTLTFNQEIDLRKGKNTFLFSDNSSQGGGIIYRAEIESTTDTLYENNKAYSYTYVEDIPSILVVENANNSGSEIVKILESSRLNVSLVKPSQVPKTLGELNLYDGVILADVSATQLDQGFLNALEAFIRLTGGGLLAIGGENSYALGGYSSTVLEDILPVSMQLESEGEKPDLSMIMVIDRSGSMTEANYGVSRIDMAKEAAMRAVEIMEPSDTVGVIAFDTIPNWAVSLQKIGENNNSIMKSIGSIQAGGGTSILPALKQAYDEIIKTDTKLKHI